MQVPALREALHAQPFRPFTIRLTDGRSLPVPHPELVAIAGRTVVVTSPAQDESFSVVDSVLIVSLDYAAATAPGPNGGGAS
jgi:hypothetical protein